jgi:hypothetical protein
MRTPCPAAELRAVPAFNPVFGLNTQMPRPRVQGLATALSLVRLAIHDRVATRALAPGRLVSLGSS